MPKLWSHAPVGLVLLIGLAFSFVAFKYTQDLEQRTTEENFRKTAIAHIALVERHVAAELAVLRSIVGFFKSSRHVNRDEFRSFTKKVLSDTQSLQALAWIPWVAHSERAAYVQAARDDGLTDFRFIEQSPQGDRVIAGERDSYSPVYYLEPYKGNESALGFDLGSNAMHMAALNKARDTDRIVMSDQMDLVQLTENATSILAFSAIYHQNLPHETLEQRRQNLAGFALGVLRISGLVSAAANIKIEKASKRLAGADLYLFDVTVDDAPRLLHIQGSGQEEENAPALTINDARSGLHVEHSFLVGDRTWSLIARPVGLNTGTYLSVQSGFVLLASLIITVMLGAYLRLMMRRAEDDEKLINLRTSELNNAIQEAQDREAHIRAIVDTAVDGIITIDEQGIVETYNHAAESLFGYTADEVIGHNLNMLMPEPYAAEHDGYLSDYKRTGEAKIIGTGREVIGKRKDGTIFPMELSVAKVRVDHRQVFTGIVRDISERQAVQAKLNEFKNALDRTRDSVFMFDTDKLRFFYANRSACDGLGYSDDELRKMTPFDIKPEFDEHRFRTLITPLQNDTKNSHRFETVHRRKDDHDFPVEISLQYISKENKTGYFVAIVRNITERRLAEDELLKAKEHAEKANRAKSAFLSRMSHELRTPLNAIIGFAQLLELEDLSPIERESTEYILKAGRHLADLINEVLDIARIESGRQNLSPEPVQVRRVLEDSWNLIRPLGTERNIQLKGLVPDECSTYVIADLQKLKQVLLNLMSNAIKYNHDGGTVTLSCSEVRDGILRISIGDTGPGIAVDNRERIFEPFERLDAEATGTEGSGIGLALSKALVEAMGGKLSLDSIPGTGSTFWLELPLIDAPKNHESEEQHGATEPSKAIPRESSTVLYIEDNIANLRLVEVALNSRPHIELIAAMQGKMGVDLALRHKPRLIILDLNLPDIHGHEVLARLKSDPVTQNIPVVIISADASQGQLNRLLAAGALAYLTKPINIKELLHTVDTVLKP